MNPVQRCLHKVDHASAVSDTTVVDDVAEALNELEAAYPRVSERVVALEAVYQAFNRRGQTTAKSPFGRFVLGSIDCRQSKISNRPA